MTSVIWDMGGTLVDTYPEVDRVLAQAVWGPRPDAAQCAEVRGLRTVSIAHAIRELSRRHGVEAAALDRAYAELKLRWRTEPAPLMAGAREVMDAVRSGGGLNLVATHRDRASAEDLLAALDVQVDDMVCAPDGLPRKPDPAMNVMLLELHNLDPACVLAVGDRAIDVAAAVGSGVRPVLLVPHGSERPATPGLEPVVIERLGELLPLLGAPGA